MSSALERLGRFADCAVRRDLEDPFEAPVLDSHRATELLAQAGSAEVGLGADVVLTPGDPETSFLDSPAARADVARIQEAVAALPNVLGTTPLGAARFSSSRTTSWTTSPTWSCPARPSSRAHDVAWRRERRPQP